MVLLVVFHESVQHIIDGFSVMKRITNMYPNTLFEGENIQMLTQKLGNFKYNKDSKKRKNLSFKNLIYVHFLS